MKRMYRKILLYGSFAPERVLCWIQPHVSAMVLKFKQNCRILLNVIRKDDEHEKL